MMITTVILAGTGGWGLGALCVTVAVTLIVIVIVIVVMVSSSGGAGGRGPAAGFLQEAELGGGDAGARDTVGRNRERTIPERQASERAPQRLERQTGVEKGAEHHVARHAGETVEVKDSGHGGEL